MDENNYYVKKYPKLVLTKTHPFYECIECRHKSPEACPCKIIETTPATDAEVERVRSQTN